MRIVVIGGSGLVGAKLVNVLEHRGHDVFAPHARYFGAELSDDTLTPDEGTIIGVTRFDDWLTRLAAAKSERTEITARLSHTRDPTPT